MANFLCTVMLFFTGVTLPMSFVQITSFGPFGVTPNKITTAGLLALVVLLGVMERRIPPRNPKGWWVGSFAASLVIGTTIAIAQGGRWDMMLVVVTILAAIVVFYFLIIYVARSIKDLDTLLYGLLIGVAVTALSVLMQWGVVQQGRTGGFAGDPNNYAFVGAMTLPIAGCYFVSARRPLAKALLAGMALLTLVAIAASLSRTAIVAMVPMALLWMIRFRRFDVLRWAIPLGALLVFMVFLSSPKWVERMNTLTSTQAAASDGSIMKRVKQNVLAVEALANNPILGVGYMQFGHWAGGRINRSTAIHNAYLAVAAELGLFGLISYLGLIAATFIEYGRAARICLSMRARADPLIERLYLLAVFLQISLVGTVVANLFLSSLRYRISWLLYACSTVIILLTRLRVRELQAEDSGVVEEPSHFAAAQGMDSRAGLFARV